MTYADIPAGPEMDRLVAEKVMGWKNICAHPEHDNEVGGEYARWLSELPFPRFAGYSNCVDLWRAAGHREKWSPSTNIAHAWEALEKMRSLSFGFAIAGDDEGGLSCEFWKYDESRTGADNWHARGATMPECICRCALKAME